MYKRQVKIVKKLREIDPNFPIIATGGPTEETVREVIQAGANAVTFTPVSYTHLHCMNPFLQNLFI